MSMMVSFVLSFFPRGVLDEILNSIVSVSEGFPSYSLLPKTMILLFFFLEKMKEFFALQKLLTFFNKHLGIFQIYNFEI